MSTRDERSETDSVAISRAWTGERPVSQLVFGGGHQGTAAGLEESESDRT